MADTVTESLIRLASAQDELVSTQDSLAASLVEIIQQMREMNKSIAEHNTQLALGQQWIKHHTGDHETDKRRLDAVEKLAKIAIAIPTIIVMGGALAGILALVL